MIKNIKILYHNRNNDFSEALLALELSNGQKELALSKEIAEKKILDIKKEQYVESNWISFQYCVSKK